MTKPSKPKTIEVSGTRVRRELTKLIARITLLDIEVIITDRGRPVARIVKP